VTEAVPPLDWVVLEQLEDRIRQTFRPSDAPTVRYASNDVAFETGTGIPVRVDEAQADRGEGLDREPGEEEPAAHADITQPTQGRYDSGVSSRVRCKIHFISCAATMFHTSAREKRLTWSLDGVRAARKWRKPLRL